MLSKHVLVQAKAFLCWDTFSALSIKLVPLQAPVAFYYPPSETYNTIVVFYPVQNKDFAQVLFLLFHEVGHYLQFQEYTRQGNGQRFWDLVHTGDGPEKACFEEESWEYGANLLQEFLLRYDIPRNDVITTQYKDYAKQSVRTYLSS